MVAFFGSIMDKKLKKFSVSTRSMLKNSRKLTYWALFVSATLIAMFWASIFLYTTFYITYLPKDVMEWDVPLEFAPCKENYSVCSTPNSVVDLLDAKRGTPFTRGQKYQIVLDLELPESPQNQQLGMFMVKVQLRSAKQKGAMIIGTEHRSTMLRFKSRLLQSLSTVFLAPFMIYGVKEEKQNLVIEFFEDFEENMVNPVSHVYMEVQSRNIQLYSAKLRIHAKFSGVRYLMYYYPVGSAIMGIAVFMNFLSALIVFSMCHFSSVKEKSRTAIDIKKTIKEIKDADNESKLKRQKRLRDLNESSKVQLSSSGKFENVSSPKIETIQSLSASVPEMKQKVEVVKTSRNELDMDFTHISRSRSPSIESIEEESCDRNKYQEFRKAEDKAVSSLPTSMVVSGDFDLLSDSTIRRRDVDQVDSD